ncbi:Pol polyprotein [Elysia marginata]|uniref:Pol polyprotein n=1 Tax=Elysia marginata TaxID=1093978 RepID=A0AAV4EB93_9GAST|nr:Pol polyprotein [Elysia marginata]
MASSSVHQKLQEQDIIKKVTEPTDWCSGLVVLPKANEKIRLCVDLTKLNEGVKRENFPLPLTEELLTSLAGGKLFTKLDCYSGFHQMPLAEESQKLTTFITPFGRFCYKRLPFGISSGPELFHREISQLVDDIPGVICDIDDILITGATKKDHDSRVREVPQRLKKAGLTLNSKCSFSQEKVKFLGQIVSAEGIQIDPEKVEAINKMADPTNLTELRRFLGMVNHVGKFTQFLTDVTKPLRELLKKESEWEWNRDHQEAMTKIKAIMTQTPLLAHYDARK